MLPLKLSKNQCLFPIKLGNLQLNDFRGVLTVESSKNHSRQKHTLSSYHLKGDMNCLFRVKVNTRLCFQCISYWSFFNCSGYLHKLNLSAAIRFLNRFSYGTRKIRCTNISITIHLTQKGSYTTLAQYSTKLQTTKWP